MVGQLSQPNIYLQFPNETPILMPVDIFTIEMERIASVVSLPGNTDSGLPRFFWVDLGLTNINIVMQGTFRDFSEINPFHVISQFMYSWKGEMSNISKNVDVNKLTLIQVDDATWGRYDYYCLNSKFDLDRSGGRIQWDYYLRFAVVVPPCIGSYGSLTTLDPITGLGPSVHVGFPAVGAETTLQTDEIKLTYDRLASTIPLSGQSNENCRPNLAFTDFGLAQPVLMLKGRFPDILVPNPFEVMEAFYRNWAGRIAGDSRTDEHVSGLLGVCLDDPRGAQAFFGVPQKMTLTRRGGTAAWDYEMSMWLTRADDAGL
jgi:hypothetical protein